MIKNNSTVEPNSKYSGLSDTRNLLTSPMKKSHRKRQTYPSINEGPARSVISMNQADATNVTKWVKKQIKESSVNGYFVAKKTGGKKRKKLQADRSITPKAVDSSSKKD